MASEIHCDRPGCHGLIYVTIPGPIKRGKLHFCDTECEAGYDRAQEMIQNTKGNGDFFGELFPKEQVLTGK